MAFFLDLPDEIRLLIAKQLNPRSLYACIRVNHSFYTSFKSSLWADVKVIRPFGGELNPTLILANAHHIQTIRLLSPLRGEYYTIVFPRLRTLRLEYDGLYESKAYRTEITAQPEQKVEFAKLHPFVNKLVVRHKEAMPAEFWEVVEADWKDLETLQVSGVIVERATGSFWRVCGRVQSLYLSEVGLLESSPILPTLSFRRLRELAVQRYSSQDGQFNKLWPFQLLEQATRSAERLRRLVWDVEDVSLPVQMILDAFAEGCWPDLCELRIGGLICRDKEMADIFRALPSRRLTYFESLHNTFGPLTFACLQELYFDHLRELSFGNSRTVTSPMVQEILAGCVNLVSLDAHHIFVKDIAKALKPWGCSKLSRLVIYIAKQEDDEEEWEGLVFEQISRLRRLQILDLSEDPYCFGHSDRLDPILGLEPLNLQLRSLSSRGTDIGCWSSLVLMQRFSFNIKRQRIGLKEGLWMTEHWENLTNINGGFRDHESEDELRRLACLFVDRGVKVH
ncbi:MAG: hypothetical protein J3R72DRAFT_423676 [Linnemannia gamsii]|nr:MAG: hypothetical protein J3R72DRAFT_423676 [Linnemannia gamsii]